MTESDAIVTGLDGEYAWVDIDAACTSCSDSGGCGLSDGKGRKRQRVRNDIGARIGERVVVGVPDGVVLRAALYCYVLPVVMALALGAVGMNIAGEIGAILGVLGGLAIGWLGMRSVGQREPLPTMQLKHAVLHLHRK